jgi:hypothetical protein
MEDNKDLKEWFKYMITSQTESVPLSSVSEDLRSLFQEMSMKTKLDKDDDIRGQ